MTDTPDPLGGYHIPFEQMPAITGRDVEGVIVDSVNVTAALYRSPIGTLPLLILDFAGSDRPLDQQPARLMFLGPPEILRNFRSLVNQAVAAALKAAANDKGTPWA